MSSSEFDRVISAGGIVLFPADTVYGLAVAPEHAERLYALKGRDPDKPAALMYFDLERALDGVPPHTTTALRRLLPGPVTAVLADGRGIRVGALGGAVSTVLQSSANRSGQPAVRRLSDVDPAIRAGVDLEIDGGELPGVASTVIDLRAFEREGHWEIIRPGPVSLEAVSAALDIGQHFDPAGYAEVIRLDIPDYEGLQAALVAASGTGARRILELGTGTGETAARLLAAHPGATLVGVDNNPAMLGTARARVPGGDFRVARLQDPLPEGRYDLVASALAIHHLTAAEKQDLFRRIAAVSERFVLADVIAGAGLPLTRGYDKPSPLTDQVAWLSESFASVEVFWSTADLAVVGASGPKDR